jgi:hypothetical protein
MDTQEKAATVMEEYTEFVEIVKSNTEFDGELKEQHEEVLLRFEILNHAIVKSEGEI